MILKLLKRRSKYVLVDIDTQRDFFLATGSACVRNHRRILARIRRIMAWARKNKIPVISISQIYPQNGNGKGKTYCIDGTEGQKKISYTLLKKRVIYPADGNTDLPRDILYRNKQILLNNRSEDPFEEPRIERLLSELGAEQFVLFGALTNVAVEATALGLLQRGKKVHVIVDALGDNDKKEAELAIRKMEAKGAKLIEAKKLAGMSHLRRVGICPCPSCQGNNHKAGLKKSILN